MKKIMSVILSVILILSMAVAAFATAETPYDDSKFFDYKGYSIHYREWKAKEQKGQIIFLHGFAHTTYCWHNMAEKLVAEGYTCVLVDLPNFGYSSRDTMEMERLPREEIVHALMVYLSDEAWYVAGHSMGGFVAESVYDKYPESVNNLLLYGTSGNINTPEMSEFVGNPKLIKLLVPLLKRLAKHEKVIDKIIKVAVKFCFFDNEYFAAYDYSEIVKSFVRPGTGEGIFYSFSMLTDTNYEAIKNGPAVLYINGSKDKVIKKSAVQTLIDNLPENSEYHIIEGGGHLFIENYADEAAELTLRFLEKNPEK